MKNGKYSRDEMRAAAVALLTAGFSTDSAATVLAAMPSDCRIEPRAAGVGIVDGSDRRRASLPEQFAYALPLNVGAVLDLSKDTDLDSRRIARSERG